ncbi:MAG: thermonuclease family protein [Terricaulis sp.]|jgi:endonuclease YncB( thermonuclease family)
MFSIVRLIFRTLHRSQARPWPRHSEPVSGDSRGAAKTKPRSAADVQALLKDLPEAKVMRVVDGDTLIVAKGWSQTMIRLDSIDCPEDGQHWGDIAAFGLIKLVGGRRVVLEEHGLDSYGRTLATIYVRHANGEEWLNVNERMVTIGHAWVMRRFYDHLPKDRQAKLNRLEAWAKSKKVGLWSTENPIPPWQWRKQDNVW